MPTRKKKANVYVPVLSIDNEVRIEVLQERLTDEEIIEDIKHVEQELKHT